MTPEEARCVETEEAREEAAATPGGLTAVESMGVTVEAEAVQLLGLTLIFLLSSNPPVSNLRFSNPPFSRSRFKEPLVLMAGSKRVASMLCILGHTGIIRNLGIPSLTGIGLA